MNYIYYCKSCNKEKEVEHSIKESPEIKCECGEVMKRKITGGAGVHYNAYGFTKKNGGLEPMKQTTKYYGKMNNPEQ